MNSSTLQDTPADTLARIVMIEDNRDNIAMARDFIQLDSSLRVSGAWPSGRSFFLWFNKSPSVELNPHYRDIALILLDINIVGEDGISVLRHLRERPELAQTKIVAWTAQNDLREACRQVGFNGFLSKPIKGLEFTTQLRRILNGEAVWE